MRRGVCFVAGTLGRGGAERQLVYMARSLRGAGVPVRVLSLTRGEANQAELEALGVPVEHVGASPSKLARNLAIVSALRRAPADVVQSAHMFTNLYAAVGARAIGAVDIGAVRNDVTHDLVGAWWLLGRASLWAPRAVIANSEAGQRAAQRHARRASQVFLVRNVVDTTRFHPARERAPGPTRLLYCGRFTAQKRPERFVQLVAALRARLGEGAFAATMIGEGERRARCEELARELGLSAPALCFAGARDDMPEQLRRADVLVLCSDWEGQPNVVLEALASGVAVVATRVGGVAEVLPGSAGRLVAPDDPLALVEAVVELAGAPGLRERLARAGLEHVRQHHADEGLAGRLLEIYTRLGAAPAAATLARDHAA